MIFLWSRCLKRLQKRLRKTVDFNFKVKSGTGSSTAMVVFPRDSEPEILIGPLARFFPEEWIAGLIAHELGHIMDTESREMSQTVAELTADALSALSEDDYPSFDPDKFAALGILLAEDVCVSHNWELNADANTIPILSKCGYDPGAFLDFLNFIKMLGGHEMGGREHPSLELRIKFLSRKLIEFEDGNC